MPNEQPTPRDVFAEKRTLAQKKAVEAARKKKGKG